MQESKKGRVLVAMSGGVDSSVAAALLVEQGYEVIGATMQVWDYSSCEVNEGSGTCCSSIDVDDARSVADKLGIPFYVLNCEAKFKHAVIDPFLKAYLEGQTPLPCVNCNTYLKFDHLVQKMKELECDYLATGHYAQLTRNSQGVPLIQTSEDDWKDQTYFLFTIDPKILPHLIFPIGHLNKPDVRKLAEKFGLVTAKKKDSTGICFVGDRSYSEFVSEHVPAEVLAQKQGFIRRYPSEEILGRHSGIHHYTYGQSRGLGLDHHEKLFVIKIDSSNNTVWVGDEKYLYTQNLKVVDTQLFTEIAEDDIIQVKIRYAHKGADAKLRRLGNGFEVQFLEPQRAVTPGQAAVFYKDRNLLGGGWITL